jgi:hypothetical protein
MLSGPIYKTGTFFGAKGRHGLAHTDSNFE